MGNQEMLAENGDGLMRAILCATVGRAVRRHQGTRLTPAEAVYVYSLLAKARQTALEEMAAALSKRLAEHSVAAEARQAAVPDAEGAD